MRYIIYNNWVLLYSECGGLFNLLHFFIFTSGGASMDENQIAWQNKDIISKIFAVYYPPHVLQRQSGEERRDPKEY